MSDDQGILLFLAAGIAVLGLIAVIGIVSSRRRRASGAPVWTASIDYLGDQPYVVSSNAELGDAAQWQLFRERFPVGSEATIPAAPGEDGTRTLHVSAVKRSLRADWPTARVGFTAYFAEYDRTEFPASYTASGSKQVAGVDADAEGLTVRDSRGASIWSSPWTALTFSNGNDLILKNAGSTIRIDAAVADGVPLEELVIKYGTFVQMHF
ncbi:hypothetical protein LQ938_06085 [Microbacterium sp. cx-55]|uniref:hypothetical protein n=1 Tax=unclassified Microbacterium TaxID=2609290 RepID=UPI001CC03D56|nr:MULTISPECIES: hypothetical protein [unclassified Microbacterium]MBZ4486688.1 hypothetical protein [Microbacterium sp. cx-55]MCC4907655.1 hypothetical protein [Microbacterium sp. cx-59]UGB36352.1 hypothetical protein LQ938_06085 [Microbacterium sp. cx-55]